MQPNAYGLQPLTRPVPHPAYRLRIRTNYRRTLPPPSINGLGINPLQSAFTAGSQVGQAIVGGASAGQSVTQSVVLSAPSIAGQIGSQVAGSAAWAGAAVPLIGAAVAGVTMLLTAMYKRNAQKEGATKVVNELEPQLTVNKDGYLNGPRTVSSQAQALANFDAMWNMVVQACSDPSLGKAGQRCISERQRGGTAPWCPTGTGCDWFILYRDPIANDPEVKPDPLFESGPGGTVIDPFTGQPTAAVAGIPASLLAIGAGVLLMLLA